MKCQCEDRQAEEGPSCANVVSDAQREKTYMCERRVGRDNKDKIRPTVASCVLRVGWLSVVSGNSFQCVMYCHFFLVFMFMQAPHLIECARGE